MPLTRNSAEVWRQRLLYRSSKLLHVLCLQSQERLLVSRKNYSVFTNYLLFILSSHVDSFQFCFKEWPLSSPNNCNPYKGHMDLICRVDGINLNIKWFYSTSPNAENSSIPLQNVTNQYFIQHDFVYVVNDSVHTATRSRLRVKNASSGYYWCRIYRNNVPLWPVSFKMDLSEPQYYSRYGSCTSDQADMINKCYYVTICQVQLRQQPQ